jgi:L-ascorbate metabolism protein UlaG (beta-lactamase superfamily)
MKLKWIGHSCFLLTADSGATLLTDPYDASSYSGAIRYQPIDLAPDVVTMSHGHADHAGIEQLGGDPVVLKAPGLREIEGFTIKGISTFHDTEYGATRGDNTVFRISADGITICHLGDLGHVLEASQVAEIGDVDVLLVPVGGTFTIDAGGATRVWQQLGPPVTIPMHFLNEKNSLRLETVDRFLAGKPDVERPGVSELTLEKEKLPASPKIVLLEPAN